MPTRERRISLAILLLSVMFFLLLLLRSRETPPSLPASPAPVIVEVKGEVPRPGIYAVDSGEATVLKALGKAGWSGNLPVQTGSRRLLSGESLNLVQSGAVADIRIGRMPAAALLALGQKLDLNSASPDDLLLVPQVRPEIAEYIVKRREKKRWEDVDELEEIQGLGPKTARRLSEYLEVFPSGRQ
ncbi:MAG: ComEA family DNA-binding protein [Syntrophobacteraceae bacterium]